MRTDRDDAHNPIPRRQFLRSSAIVTAAAAGYSRAAPGQSGPLPAAAPSGAPGFRDLFNGRDLSGWVNVNTDEKTWTVRDGVLICSGHPNGVIRTDRQYENFILQIDWMHMEPGGNSGLYVWSNGQPGPRGPNPNGIEIQILDLDWVKLNTKAGSEPPPIAYVHGEFIPVGGVKFVPDTPRGQRSMSVENRAKGRGEWNTYAVIAVDGVIKMGVNGKVVNGISGSSQKKGYLCLQSEGAEIHFRNVRILELPPGVTTPEQSAPEIR